MQSFHSQFVQMLPLWRRLLRDVAAHYRVAVLVDLVGELLSDHADHTAFPVLQVSLVDEKPLLHAFVLSAFVQNVVGGFCSRLAG